MLDWKVEVSQFCMYRARWKGCSCNTVSTMQIGRLKFENAALQAYILYTYCMLFNGSSSKALQIAWKVEVCNPKLQFACKIEGISPKMFQTSCNMEGSSYKMHRKTMQPMECSNP